MNKNHEENFNDRPGLRCRLVRRWEAWRGPAAGHTALTTRHMETCEDCQAFFAEDFAFEDLLRSSAQAEKRATAPQIGFEQRILRAVRESQPEAPQRGKASLVWSLAGTVAGVALALVVAQQMTPEKTAPEFAANQPANNTTPMPDAGAELTEEDAGMPAHWWQSLGTRESALELAAKNPLQQEIDSISTDAQSVLGFLAMNFLPTEMAAAKSQRDESRVIRSVRG